MKPPAWCALTSLSSEVTTLPAPAGPCLRRLPSAHTLAQMAFVSAPQWLPRRKGSALAHSITCTYHMRESGRIGLISTRGEKQPLLSSYDMPDTRLSPLPPIFLIYFSNDVMKQMSVFPFY